MYSKNIIFQHGHIYDAETKKRIIVKEGVACILLLQNANNFKIEEFKKLEGQETKIITTELEKLKYLTHYKKIASKGSKLYFSLKEKNENDTEYSKKSRFTIELLEDLFLYSCKHWSKKLIEDGKLFDCACVVNESEDDKLNFFESIYSSSIASVYKKTHVHYFGNEGSPSQNTFDSVYFLDENNTYQPLECKRRFTDIDKYIKKKPEKN